MEDRQNQFFNGLRTGYLEIVSHLLVKVLDNFAL